MEKRRHFCLYWQLSLQCCCCQTNYHYPVGLSSAATATAIVDPELHLAGCL